MDEQGLLQHCFCPEKFLLLSTLSKQSYLVVTCKNYTSFSNMYLSNTRPADYTDGDKCICTKFSTEEPRAPPTDLSPRDDLSTPDSIMSVPDI